MTETVPLADGGFPQLLLPEVAPAVARYVTEGMHGIEGWGITPFVARLVVMLDAHQKARGHRGTLFEIGVHHGRSAVLLGLLARRAEALVLVDLFERQGENIDRSGEGSRSVLEGNLAAWCPGARAEIVQANTLELDFASVPALAAGVRLAHVDGGHHLEAVLNDLRKTEAVLGDEGIVIVDDFMHSGFPEVNEGLHAHFAGATGLSPVAIGQNKLVATRTANAPALIEALDLRMRPPYGKRVRFHGQDCLCLDNHWG